MKEYHGSLQRYHDGDDKGHWDILQRKGMKKMFKKTKLRWGERKTRIAYVQELRGEAVKKLPCLSSIHKHHLLCQQRPCSRLCPSQWIFLQGHLCLLQMTQQMPSAPLDIAFSEHPISSLSPPQGCNSLSYTWV
jgi:hypothetical protein